MKNYLIILIITFQIFSIGHLNAGIYTKAIWKITSYNPSLTNIRNINGKYYAYIVLLFNENPHFVNLIQEDSISLEMMKKSNFHIKAYKNYLSSMKNYSLKKSARHVLNIFQHPEDFSIKNLRAMEANLEKIGIIIRFTKQKKNGKYKMSLDYCVYGKKILINIKHPFFSTNKKIYNIQPYIYYDEFSTSNSTFYFDMIYINPEEVENDYIITKKILNGEKVDFMFFVGARVSLDMIYCLKKAFNKKSSIKREISNIFEVHELTHKILNNRFNMYDQILGEEMALSSTIYVRPYLGLAVLYSYLDYNAINPHRLGALNYINFLAEELADYKIVENPSLIKELDVEKLKKLTRKHFLKRLKKISH